jgi:hypothetical protein
MSPNNNKNSNPPWINPKYWPVVRPKIDKWMNPKLYDQFFAKGLFGKRVSPVSQLKALQQWENFHHALGVNTITHGTAERYRLTLIMQNSTLSDFVLPTGSQWVDPDKRMTVKDAMWHARFQSPKSFTLWIYISVGTTGSSIPSNTEYATDLTKSIEEQLDSLFVTGEFDYALFCHRQSSLIRGFDGSDPVYEINEFIPIKDLLDKIIGQYFNPADETVRTYNIWAITYTRNASQSITHTGSFNVVGRINLARSRLI